MLCIAADALGAFTWGFASVGACSDATPLPPPLSDSPPPSSLALSMFEGQQKATDHPWLSTDNNHNDNEGKDEDSGADELNGLSSHPRTLAPAVPHPSRARCTGQVLCIVGRWYAGFGRRLGRIKMSIPPTPHPPSHHATSSRRTFITVALPSPLQPSN
ncbi:hypothetical protein LXA43DRAFT_1098554 [Ganoderma leucocontextum]|nr:hypothetical protein LXA43DRAFT_1098554 [Ganoderma leucocontextum]